MLLAEDINMSDLSLLEYRVHQVITLLERDFPISLNMIVFHLMHHLPKFIQRFVPVYGFWMFPLESFNSWLAHRVHNRRFPESI